MKIVDHEVLSVEVCGDLERIERVARVCYRSEPKGDAATFVRGLIKRKHFAMLEFADVIVVIKTSRGVANELVRHRIASYAQESTRFVDYAKDAEGIEVVSSPNDIIHQSMVESWAKAEQAYFEARFAGVPVELARDVLPLATATTIVCKWNFRQVLNVVIPQRLHGSTGRPLRGMKALMAKFYPMLSEKCPVVFPPIEAPLG